MEVFIWVQNTDFSMPIEYKKLIIKLISESYWNLYKFYDQLIKFW